MKSTQLSETQREVLRDIDEEGALRRSGPRLRRTIVALRERRLIALLRIPGRDYLVYVITDAGRAALSVRTRSERTVEATS